MLETNRTSVSLIALTDADFFLLLVNTPGWKQFITDRTINTVADAETYLNSSFLASYRANQFGY